MKRSSPLFKLLMAVNLVILLFSNISCAIPEMETDDGVEYSILGTWESSWGEKFEISETEFKNYYGEAASYSGNYIYQKKLNNTSGYIYLRYTRAYEETDEDKSSDSSWTTWDGETYYRYSTSAPDVGKWYAVYYSELTDSSVKITGAAYGAKDTLEEAILEFTVEAGYFSIPSECVKTASANGVIPQSNTAVPSGTVLATTYLSNFAGNYNLSNGVTLNVGAKINIHQDTNHYWNANVVNPSYDVATKTYSFFLLHSSQPNASGSIDPGITGNEQFISQQGLFWSRMTLTAHPGSQWEIKWSSVWTDSMQTAENLTLDKTDSFTGPATSMIHYSYKFYFGNPTVNSAGWCEVDKGSLIYQTEFDSALPTDKTWSQILTQYDIASKINMPEGKEADYWWYSTGAITGIQSAYVYTLNNSYKPALEEYEFYLALKDRPVNTIYTRPGKYYRANTGYLEITENTIRWNDDVYTILDGAQWSEAGNSTTNPKLPLQYCYLVTKDSKNYYCLVEYYVNNNFKYNNFRTPKETTDTTCTTTKVYTIFDSRKTTLNILPQYYTRTAFWMGMGSPYSEGDETEDDSNFCYFILYDENTIKWVTYPLVEDEDYGEEYRERHEYSLRKDSNGLWQLQENVSEADADDYSGTSNLSMMDYVTGLELIFDGNTISVDYQGSLQIKEWYTKVDSEPHTQTVIY